MRRKGFTLIELLVVIAIIAILAAILFPVFAPAPAQLISLVDMRDIGAWKGWTGYWGVMPWHQDSPKGKYGTEYLSGAEVTAALDAAEAGKAPPGQGGKFGPRVGTLRHNGGEN